MNVRHALALTSVLLIAACGNSDAPSAEIACGVDDSGRPKNAIYQALVEEYVAQGLPGLVLSIDVPGEPVWQGAGGFASVEGNERMTPCHQQHHASISKTFTAQLILTLVDEGELTLDDPVANFLPAELAGEIPNGRTATIRQLLNHTSGMPDVFDIDFIVDFFNQPARRYDVRELLDYVRGKEALAPAGERYQYADTNYLLLTLVADRLEGDHAVALHERVLEPLALDSIHYHDAAYPEPTGLVRSYWDRWGDGSLEDVSDWQVALTASIPGSDGVLGTVTDVARLVAAAGRGDLLSPQLQQQVTTWVDEPATQEAPMTDAYGLGLMRQDLPQGTWIGHSGSQLGAGSFAYFHADSDISIAAATNVGMFFSPEKRELFFGHLLQALDGTVLGR